MKFVVGDVTVTGVVLFVLQIVAVAALIVKTGGAVTVAVTALLKDWQATWPENTTFGLVFVAVGVGELV